MYLVCTAPTIKKKLLIPQFSAQFSCSQFSPSPPMLASVLSYVSSLVVLASLIVPVVPRRTTNFTLHVPPLIDFDPRPSTGHDCTTSHFQSFTAFGVLSLVVILLARALRHAVCASFWSPPRGVSIIDSGPLPPTTNLSTTATIESPPANDPLPTPSPHPNDHISNHRHRR
jgi:hypothetical protein